MRMPGNAARRGAIWLALAVLAAGMAACGRHAGHFHVGIHPMIFNQTTEGILPAVHNQPPPETDPNQPGIVIVREDPEDPAQAIHIDNEGQQGFVWVFPGRDEGHELRLHFLYSDMHYDDTIDIDLRVEVTAPYPVIINGKEVMVTQDMASDRLLDAFAEVVRRAEKRMPPEQAREPMVSALRQLVPWNDGTAHPRPMARGPNPWAK